MQKNNILLISLLLFFLLIGTTVYRAYFSRHPIKIPSPTRTQLTPAKSAKDKRCTEEPVFSGMCKMHLTTIKYDENRNDCISVSGGGCGVNAPFTSAAECRKLCVDGWDKQISATGYEKILYSEGFQYGLTGKLVKFDTKGSAVLKTSGSSTMRYTLIDGFNIEHNIYQMAAIVEQTTTTVEENSSSADYQGTFLQLYQKNQAGNLVSVGEHYAFEAPGIRVAEPNLTQAGNRLIFEYSTVPCGGNAPLACGEKKKKMFIIDSSSIAPID